MPLDIFSMFPLSHRLFSGVSDVSWGGEMETNHLVFFGCEKKKRIMVGEKVNLRLILMVKRQAFQFLAQDSID